MPSNWRPVPGFDRYYEVSDEGEVRSLDRTVAHGKHGFTTYRGRVLKARPTKGGYLLVALSYGTKRRAIYVHHLVLLAFVGPRPPAEGRSEIRHLNGDKRDNRLTNLAYGSAKENAADRRLHAEQRRTA